MKKIVLFLTLFATTVGAFAQVTSDALLFSDIRNLSTARSIGVGSALGALGADMSCLSSNPAGIAFYRNSEVSIAPGLAFSGIRTSFAGNSSKDNRSSFALGTLGLVLAQPVDSETWKSINFGIGVNRINSFNQSFSFSGETNGSRIVSFTEAAQGLFPDELNPFESQLAYDTYLIDNFGGGTVYEGALNDSNFVEKTGTVKQSGGITELAIALGANYKNKLYFGLGVGIDFLGFRDVRDYREFETTGLISFKQMDFKETRRVNGAGVNAKFGVNYRINHIFLVGISAQTPTLFGLKERYYTSMFGEVIYNDTLQTNEYESLEGRYPHRLSTPWILTGSLGIILGKKGLAKIGFVGIEASYLNYRTAKFSPTSSDTDLDNKIYMDGLNSNLDGLLGAVYRLRTGAEFVVDAFRIRLGYQFQSSPYQEKIDGVSDLRHDISLGFGIRQRVFYVDFSYMHTLRDFEYVPYVTQSNISPQQAINKVNGGQVFITVGFRFGQKLD